MKTVIDFIDRCLCKYIGITKQDILPQSVKKTNNLVILLKTESHKRHSHEQSWEEFSQNDLENLSETAKQKLGVSLGKVIAKNLIISFDQTSIEKEEK
jgi:hypothetical protein